MRNTLEPLAGESVRRFSILSSKPDVRSKAERVFGLIHRFSEDLVGRVGHRGLFALDIVAQRFIHALINGRRFILAQHTLEGRIRPL